eukprot:scaffold1621_cov350-Prasinococcus_capsulatus_cf.AAC.8
MQGAAPLRESLYLQLGAGLQRTCRPKLGQASAVVMVMVVVAAAAAVPVLVRNTRWGDLVPEGQGNALRLGADADVATELAVGLLLNRAVDEGVLAKDALGVQELAHVGDGGVDGHLVLPLKLRPHVAEGHVRAGGRADVVHDIDVYVVEHYDRAVGASGLVHDVAEDDTRLRGAHLDVGANLLGAVGPQCVVLGPLHKLQVAHRGQLQAEVLHGLHGAVHHRHV